MTSNQVHRIEIEPLEERDGTVIWWWYAIAKDRSFIGGSEPDLLTCFASAKQAFEGVMESV